MKVRSLIFVLALFCSCTGFAKPSATPRIVNIVNFIRQMEPRDAAITENVLYETVHQQILQLNNYQLPGTFLLQYDALINPIYQTLLKKELNAQSEIGAWWEITQPHVEAAGLKWRGKYPWDWHANIGFATGYSPKERELLVDVYMKKFKEIFGRYPASVGSWFIDSHSLQYMYEKYGIVASCNCKDQYGTDGYTLWGGYWNQAYYPSRKNAYMPAQTEQGQIPVPVFRMLGSDPIYQYDSGLGSNGQGVLTLEPVYPEAGGSRKWIDWFFKCMFEDPCLNFNYVQAGQENSFTWNAMKNGLEMQIPMLAALSKQGKVRIESLETSGRWFRKKYKTTPPTSLSALTDVREEGHQTVWYNSRFYRANLLWKAGTFRLRDIHLFNERYESDYLHRAGTSTQCVYTTLPLVDGFLWSTSDQLAGLRLMRLNTDGQVFEMPLNKPVIRNLDTKTIQITCESEGGESFKFTFHEDRFELSASTGADNWLLELCAAPGKDLPFTTLSDHTVSASQNGFDYSVSCLQGRFVKPELKADFIFRIVPSGGKLVVDCNTKD